MTGIKSVIVQIKRPSEGDPGQVTEGFYTVDDGYLQMTFGDGKPLENPAYRVRLGEGADARAIAGSLTLAIHRELKGEQVKDFARSLSYPRLGLA